MASRQKHMKQRRRACDVKNQELLGMRVRQYRQLNDCRIACPLCQSMVRKVNMSTHKKTRKRKQLRDGNTADNYRKTIQTVRIFDGVNAEPRIVKYDIDTYGPDDPGINDYDIVRVINKDDESVGLSVGSTASAAVGGADAGNADDADNADDTDADDGDDSDAEALSAVCAAAGEAEQPFKSEAI